jgi:hypothetical protein
MTQRYTWDEVSYSLIEGGWFDWEDRPKTLKAFKKVIEKISDDEVGTLMERISIVFAPAAIDGCIMPFGNLLSSDSSEESASILVYLPHRLERRRQPYVDSVVAHELAHVLLHPFHSGPGSNVDQEREADAKIGEWGFAPAYE